MPKVVLSDAAFLEYDAEYDRYFRIDPSLALRFDAALNRTLEQVAEAPDRWPTYAADLRFHLLDGFPFHVVYSFTQHEVTVIALAHGSRRPSYWGK